MHSFNELILCDNRKETLLGKKVEKQTPAHNLPSQTPIAYTLEGRLLTRWKLADIVGYTDQHPGPLQMISLLHVDLQHTSELLNSFVCSVKYK